MKLDKNSQPAFGSSFDGFLEEQNMLSEVEALATKRVLAYQIITNPDVPSAPTKVSKHSY